MYNFLKNTKDQLNAQLHSVDLLLETYALVPILRKLNSHDTKYLNNLFIKYDWNVGSRHVIAVLQSANILSISDYIYEKCSPYLLEPDVDCTFQHVTTTTLLVADEPNLDTVRQSNEKEVEHIMEDLLDGHYELLGDMIMHLDSAHRKSLAIANLLGMAVQRLIDDLFAYPELKHRNYFTSLTSSVPAHNLDAFRIIHRNHILSLESQTIFEAISNMREWNSRAVVEIGTSMHSLISSSVGPSTSSSFTQLFAHALVPFFAGWRCWLLLWRSLVTKPSVGKIACTAISTQLHELFVRFQNSKNSVFFYLMLISARQTAYCSLPGFGSYDDWFRRTFGAMGYKQTADEFRLTIEALSNIVAYEREQDVMETHLETRIETPPHCFELVRKFKNLTRSELEKLQRADGEEGTLSSVQPEGMDVVEVEPM